MTVTWSASRSGRVFEETHKPVDDRVVTPGHSFREIVAPINDQPTSQGESCEKSRGAGNQRHGKCMHNVKCRAQQDVAT
jgi:hypothetical protein